MDPAAARARSAADPGWAEQALASHPAARFGAAMAYDAATGTAVLFGGDGHRGRKLGDTWTWDGTSRTRQHPAVSPPAREEAAIAYDAATGTVLLFGGYGLGGIWTRDGTTWTPAAPGGQPVTPGAGVDGV